MSLNNLNRREQRFRLCQEPKEFTIYSGQLSNVRAALEWSFGLQGDDEVATRLAAASMPLFMELSLLIECQGWAERAIARLGDRHKNSRREMEISRIIVLGADAH